MMVQRLPQALQVLPIHLLGRQLCEPRSPRIDLLPAIRLSAHATPANSASTANPAAFLQFPPHQYFTEYAVEAVSAVFAVIVIAVVLSVHVLVVTTALALSVVTMQLA